MWKLNLRLCVFYALPLTIGANVSRAESSTFGEVFAIPAPTAITPHEHWVEAAVNSFVKNVATECAKQNQEAQKNNLFLCHQSDCAESLTTFSLPEEVSVSFTYNTLGVAMLRLNWKWHKRNQGSTGVCYHPRLTPIVFAFENKLRAQDFEPLQPL